ncbi:MAG: hypothetical protein OEY24_00400 [Candidatus Bathyarchaeota archaeon]|nr:hypothetical protein [Candidatus Bathyarchaeota archaeon]MDH5494153.1 hypothetical protein [Candidatus Bathyarchaeota archaeon]
MAYAIGQNPNSGKWIRQFTKVFLLSSYFVGIFFILETSFLLLFPEGYFEIQLYLYAVAIFIVAFTPRLLVFVKRKLRKEPKSVTLNEEY